MRERIHGVVVVAAVGDEGFSETGDGLRHGLMISWE